jgi:hypothetical protein
MTDNFFGLGRGSRLAAPLWHSRVSLALGLPVRVGVQSDILLSCGGESTLNTSIWFLFYVAWLRRSYRGFIYSPSLSVTKFHRKLQFNDEISALIAGLSQQRILGNIMQVRIR